MKRTRARAIAGAVLAVCLIGSAAGQDEVIVELRTGERLSGTLVSLAGGVYKLRVGAVVREVKESDVRRIDFGEKSAARVPDVKTTVDVKADNAPLREVVAGIAARVGRPIFVDPGIDERVTLSLAEIPWRDAVALIARLARCEVRDFGEGGMLFHQPPKVTVQFTNANLRTVLQLISAYSGKSLIAAPGVASTVTLDVKEVSWTRALDALVKSNGLHAARRGDLVVVSDKPLSWGSRDLDHVEAGQWPGPVKEPSALVDLDVKDVPMAEVCERIGRQVKANILVGPSLDAKVTLKVARAPWRDLISFLARAHDASLELRGELVLLEPRLPCTFQATDAAIPAVLQLLAEQAGKNLVMSADVKGTLTVDLKDVPFLDALTGIAAAAELPVTLEGNDLLRIGNGQARGAGRAAGGGKPREVKFPGGRTIALAIEAILGSKKEPGARRAIVSGRVLREGDEVLDGRGDPTGVRVTTIEVDALTFEDVRTRAVARVGLLAPEEPEPSEK